MSASNKKKLRKEQNAAALTKKQQQAQKEAKSLKMYTITFTVVMVLVIAIVLGILLSNPINSLVNQNTVAVTINDHELSIADLSYFYVDTIVEAYNNIYTQYYSLYGSYAAYFIPFSLYSPMDEQEYTGDEADGFETWADYFIHEAIESAKSVYALYDMAIQDEHVLSTTEQTALNNYKSTLKAYAEQQGYSSSASFLRQTYGNGCNVKNYYNYFKVSTYASSYYSAYKESLEFVDDDYRAYELDKYDEYSSFSYVYYLVSVSSYKGEGTKNEETGVTEYTEEELAQALADAKADADALLAAAPADADAFDAAVSALAINAEKTVSATECVNYPYSYVASNIRDWVISSEREEGEVSIVPVVSETTDEEGNVTETETTGYYVVLFNGRQDHLDKMVTVRHILIQFEGGEKDEETGETVYSDLEKVTAKNEAEKIYQEWLDGDKTEDSFSELANEYSEDNDGEVTDGGIYENIYVGQMVTAFNDWCFDKSRNPGDHDIIETEYGYHIMYFVKTQDLCYRDYLINEDLITEACEKFLEDATNSVKYTEGKLSRMERDIIIYS